MDKNEKGPRDEQDKYNTVVKKMFGKRLQFTIFIFHSEIKSVFVVQFYFTLCLIKSEGEYFLCAGILYNNMLLRGRGGGDNFTLSLEISCIQPEKQHLHMS